MIDVQEERLVQAKSNERYVALSYVWGKAVSLPLQTTVGNFQALKQHHAISPTNESIARVIRDAMQLVKSIGERYLWVDSLCIVQDDPVGKMDAIRNMDIVYGCALLTVISATNQGANETLPGVRTGGRPLLALRQSIRGFPLVWRGPELSDMARYTLYEHRAWTLQEKLLSRRCLYLSCHQAYFHCSSDYMCEDYHNINFFDQKPGDRGQKLPFPENPLYIMQGYPLKDIRGDVFAWSYCIYIYMSLVRTYTSRQLSYDSDAVNAFQGILGILGDACRGTFTYALPEDLIDIALLWVPARGAGIKKRAKGNFPTWAWVGWTGVVSYNQHYPVHIPGQPPTGEYFPPNNGYVRDTRLNVKSHLSLDELNACRNHEFKFRSEVASFVIQDNNHLSTIKRAAAGKLYDVIAEGSMPGLSKDDFLPPQTSNMLPRPPLLYFAAQTVQAPSFTLADALPQKLSSHERPGQTQLYFKGKKCGVVFQDSDIFEGLFPLTREVIRDFILLSRMPGCADSDYKTWFDKDFRTKGWYICNVMLIEWDASRDWNASRSWAERVATGVIHSDVWQKQQVESKLVILG
jgi:hypothetical protein